MAAASPVLKRILEAKKCKCDNPDCIAGSNFTTTHVTVDVDKRVMTAFVRLVYTGTADIGTSREREALFALKEAFGVKVRRPRHC